MNKKTAPTFQRLKTAFKVAAVAVGLMAGAQCTGRPLQNGEIELADGFFGDALARKHVRLHFFNFTPANKRGFTFFNHVFFFNGYKTEDFSKDVDDTPMHELGHVVQYQHPLTNIFKFCTKYDYQLTKDSKFKDFCVEQQASLVGDYAIRFLGQREIQLFGDTPESRALLQKVVEEEYPRARLARLARAADGKAAFNMWMQPIFTPRMRDMLRPKSP